MEIIRQQQNEFDATTWYAKIGGLAADGLYRLADLTLTEEPVSWLAANPGEAQAVIDAGTYNEEFATRKVDFDDLASKVETEITWLNATIPTIDAMTAAQVRDVAKRLAQENQAMFRAWRYILRHL